MKYLSPLRYPGGKAKILPFMKEVFEDNNLFEGVYVEPFAGGSGLALELLRQWYAAEIWLNDLDRSVYAFWHSVLNDTENLCRKINDTPVTIDEWIRQREAYQHPDDLDLDALGFAFFFLNRTNRSGIVSGSVIGGLEQRGSWKLDVRFNKKDLIDRIKRIGLMKNRIRLFNEDALEFLDKVPSNDKTLCYLDPPYYAQGQRLYLNALNDSDHALLAAKIREMGCYWLVSYDDHSRIHELYKAYRGFQLNVIYSAQSKRVAKEVMFADHRIKVPLSQSIAA